VTKFIFPHLCEFVQTLFICVCAHVRVALRVVQTPNNGLILWLQSRMG